MQWQLWGQAREVKDGKQTKKKDLQQQRTLSRSPLENQKTAELQQQLGTQRRQRAIRKTQKNNTIKAATTKTKPTKQNQQNKTMAKIFYIFIMSYRARD